MSCLCTFLKADSVCVKERSAGEVELKALHPLKGVVGTALEGSGNSDSRPRRVRKALLA